MSELTQLFLAAGDGNQKALNRLLEVMYAELRQMAHARLRGFSQNPVLDTTELVHESHLRFLNAGRLNVANRAHFLAYSARVMRSIIVDFVRQRQSERRRGGSLHVTLDTSVSEGTHVSEDQILRLNEALEALSQSDARLVQVVELRYFGGLNENEIAAQLGVSDLALRGEPRESANAAPKARDGRYWIAPRP